ncbi:hypothetical protein EVAR_97212_1 [Eumeta japonica]|uniref:Uncharacterized protein n=1 Tax=Eumeta variegata TaxID=151549 RepID=A0A4C1WH78_EUMVA|nr:hypothetical protein EVAR_97212_1 [Eumeta japonica]
MAVAPAPAPTALLPVITRDSFHGTRKPGATLQLKRRVREVTRSPLRSLSRAYAKGLGGGRLGRRPLSHPADFPEPRHRRRAARSLKNCLFPHARPIFQLTVRPRRMPDHCDNEKICWKPSARACAYSAHTGRAGRPLMRVETHAFFVLISPTAPGPCEDIHYDCEPDIGMRARRSSPPSTIRLRKRRDGHGRPEGLAKLQRYSDITPRPMLAAAFETQKIFIPYGKRQNSLHRLFVANGWYIEHTDVLYSKIFVNTLVIEGFNLLQDLIVPSLVRSLAHFRLAPNVRPPGACADSARFHDSEQTGTDTRHELNKYNLKHWGQSSAMEFKDYETCSYQFADRNCNQLINEVLQNEKNKYRSVVAAAARLDSREALTAFELETGRRRRPVPSRLRHETGLAFSGRMRAVRVSVNVLSAASMHRPRARWADFYSARTNGKWMITAVHAHAQRRGCRQCVDGLLEETPLS